MRALNWKSKPGDDQNFYVEIGELFELFIEEWDKENDEYGLVLYSTEKSKNGKYEEFDLLQGKQVSLSAAKHLGYLFVQDVAALVHPEGMVK